MAAISRLLIDPTPRADGGGQSVAFGALDPSVAGVDLPIPSLFGNSSSGQWYFKSGTSATAWTAFGTSGAGITQTAADARYAFIGGTNATGTWPISISGTAAVATTANAVAWTNISSKPTTIGGYGITDYNSLGDARWLGLGGGTLTGQLQINGGPTWLTNSWTRNLYLNGAMEFNGTSFKWGIGNSGGVLYFWTATVDDASLPASYRLQMSSTTAQFNVAVVSTGTHYITGPTSTNRGLMFQTASVNRWMWYADNGTESGSAAGSAMRLAAYDDAGTFVENVITITRAAGASFVISRPLTVTRDGAAVASRAVTANSAVYLTWENSVGTRRGYMGFATASSSSMYINNDEAGPIIFQPSGGGGGNEAARITSTLFTLAPSVSMVMGTQTSASSGAPLSISMGGTFSNTPGTASRTKIKLFDVGGENVYGIGLSSARFEFHALGADYTWYVSNVAVMHLLQVGPNPSFRSLTLFGDFVAGRSSGTGVIYFGTNATAAIYWDGSYFNMTGGPARNSLNHNYTPQVISSAAPTSGDVAVDGTFWAMV